MIPALGVEILLRIRNALRLAITHVFDLTRRISLGAEFASSIDICLRKERAMTITHLAKLAAGCMALILAGLFTPPRLLL